MPKLMPCLWFDGNAEEAARFYTSVFPNSKITQITHYGPSAAKSSGPPEGSVMTVVFEIDGQRFMGLNGGPHFKFSPAISFMVNCNSQEEIDNYWKRLSDGGQEGQCGWLTDKFGLSWQIVPAATGELIDDSDPARSDRVLAALMQMNRIDLRTLQNAYAGIVPSR